MGRVLKRVPLNFDWPRDKVWRGYINPISPLYCTVCEGNGESIHVRNLYERWYGYDTEPEWVWCDEAHTRRWNRMAWCNNLDEQDVRALLNEDRLYDFTRVAKTEEQQHLVQQRVRAGYQSYLPFHNGYTPTPEEVNETHRRHFIHDGLNAWIVIKSAAERYHLPLYCEQCQGEGYVWAMPEEKEAWENWEPIDPLLGEGYQLWENTSQGSPQSPVFSTLQDLCAWCAEHATTFGSQKATASQWEQMLSNGTVYHQEGNLFFC